MQKNQEWKSKVQELFQSAQDEFKRTTEIGRKMLSASKTNSNLHEAYEELGMLVAKEIKKGKLKWDNARVKELLCQINDCEKDLETIESEVKKIKFAAGPTDISAEAKLQSEVKTEAESKEKKDDDKDS
ncbi:MAG: hypothetical protein EP319_03195 [Deltaproteobacteria bacterium]|nr:MAG: hypothetical protein EP319_03195 [Deltaproteobacteria bacterium]